MISKSLIVGIVLLGIGIMTLPFVLISCWIYWANNRDKTKDKDE